VNLNKSEIKRKPIKKTKTQHICKNVPLLKQNINNNKKRKAQLSKATVFFSFGLQVKSFFSFGLQVKVRL